MQIKRFLNHFRHYRHKTFILAGLFLIIVTPTIFFILRNAKKTEAGWFNDGWNYRKSIPITNTGTALANFQVKLTLDTATLITANKLQPSCGDLRFTSFAGVELPYWIESGCNSASTIIWIKVDTIPASGNTIYLYYGNPTAGSGTNITRTFIFGDDFESGDLKRWSDSVQTSTSTIQALTGIQKKTGSFSAESYHTTTGQAVLVKTFPLTTGVVEFDFYDTSTVTGAIIMGGSNANFMGINTGAYASNYAFRCAWGAWNNTNISRATGWHKAKIVHNGATSAITIDGASAGSCTDTYNIDTAYHGSFWGVSGAGSYVDNYYVRQYAATEPTLGSLSSEEVGGGPVFHYSFDEGFGTTAYNNTANTPNDNLVGYWKFNDASSGTSPAPVDDAKVNTSSFAGNAAYSSTSKIGYAATFDGNGDYITVPNNTNLNLTNYSLSAWINIDNLANSSDHFIISRYSYAANQGYGIGVYSTGQVFCDHNGSSGRLASAVSLISAGSWYHVACVYNGGLLSIYINGTIVKSDARAALSNYNSNLYIGTPADSVGTDTYSFSGKIDNAQVYNRALSSAEIITHYRSADGDLIGNPTWVEGATPPNQSPLGKAISFDGNDYIDITNLGNGNVPRTFSAWVKDFPASGRYEIINNQNTYFNIQDGKACWYVFGSNSTYLCSTTTLSPSSWNHVLATYNNGVENIYINGKLDATTTLSATSDASTSDGVIGICSMCGYSLNFSGKIDDVKIFVYELTANQVVKEFNRGFGTVLGEGTKSTDPGTSNLKGWWKFDESQGSLIAQDSSGSNNYATSTNGAFFTSGKLGKAAGLDGTDDTFAIANEANFDLERTNSFSISAWIKTGTVADQEIFSKVLQGAPYNGYEMGVSSTGKLRFIAINDTGTTNRMGGYGHTFISDNNWHHVVVSYSGTSNMAGVTMYVDGIKQTVTNEHDSLSASILNNITPYIGSRYNSYARFNGQIDDVRIYNKTLNSGEVSFLLSQGGPIIHYSYDEGTGTNLSNQADSDPVVKPTNHWKFNEGTGTSIADEADKTTDTASNLSWVSGKIGSAGSFNGTSSYVSTGDLSATLPFSFSTWIYLPSTPTTWYTILTTDDFTTNYFGFWVQVDANLALSLNYGDGTVSGPTARRSGATANSSVPTGQWVHLAGVARGPTDISLYINGVSYTVTYSGSGGALATNTNTGLIGRGGNSSNYWNGYLDDVRIYNGQALTPTDINHLYTSTAADIIGTPIWSDGIQKSVSEKPMGKSLILSDTTVGLNGNNSLATGNTPHSVSVWLKPTSAPPSLREWPLTIGWGAGAYHLLIGTDYQAQIGVWAGGQCPNLYLTPNVWQHVTSTFDGTNLRCYLNGNYISSSAATFNFPDTIVHLGQGGEANYKGNIDELKIYPYMLSEAEVKTEYNRGSGAVLGVGQHESNPTGFLTETFSYKVPITVTNSSGSTINNAEVLVSLNTSALISSSKMQSDCDDLRFTDSNGVVLNHWLEAGCNTTATQVWVKIPILPTGDTTIYAYYGNSSATNREQAWAGSFIVLSTVSCPAGWTRDANFDSKFPYGASSYGSSGGSDSHTGSETISTGAASSGAEYRPGATWPFPSSSHTHTLTLTLGSGTIVPPYVDMIFCASSDLNLFTNSITAYTTTPSGNRTRFTTLDSKFPRGSTSYTGGGGGSASHSHTYTGSSSAENGSTVLRDTGFGDYRPQIQSASGHTHTVSGSSTGSSSTLPSYLSTIFAQMSSATVADANTVTMATALPPLGWSDNSNYSNRMPYGSSSYNTTGGAATHTHTLSAITTGGPSGTVGPVDGGNGSVGSSNHTHSTSATNTQNHNNLPAYYATKFISRKTTSGSTSVGSETSGNSLTFNGSDTLKAWWKFDETSGSNKISQDSSGNNNYGTPMGGGTYSTGKFGQALSLDGTDDYVSLPNYIRPTSNFSLSAWVNLPTDGNYFNLIIGGDDATSGNVQRSFQFRVNDNTGYPEFLVFVGGSFTEIIGTKSLFNTGWRYMTATHSTTDGIKLYVDGVLVAANASITSPIDPGTGIAIGTLSDERLNSLYKGLIDDAKIYNKTLSPAEIAYEYNQGKPLAHWSLDQKAGLITADTYGTSVTTNGLAGFWTMDSTTVNDMSGNGNNLTNSGTPTSTTGIKGLAVNYTATSSQYSYCTDANCGADLDYQGNGLTVSAWIKPTSILSSGYYVIVQKEDTWVSSTSNGGYVIYVGNNAGGNQIIWALRNSNGTASYINLDSGISIAANTWQHITGTYDGNIAKIYINGALAATAPYGGGVKNTTQNFMIGAHKDGSSYFNGIIDHTKVWQRALSAKEVLLEYQSDEKYGYLTNFPTDNSQWTTGKFGNALTFDGSNDYVSIPNSLYQEPESLTLSAWIKPTGWVDKETASASHWIFPHQSDGFAFATGYNIWYTWILTGSGRQNLASTYNANLNEWHHLVLTYDKPSGRIRFYVDGQLKDSLDITPNTPMVYYHAPLDIGDAGYGNHAADGSIDEVKLYNYALTANQVLVDYNNGAAVRF